jgi:protein translocase SecG subunit
VHTLVNIIQLLTSLGLIVLMAVQTDKAEQSGVMGLGASGGRSAGEIDLDVGAERILKPLTKWCGGAFLASSILAAIDPDIINIWHVLGGTVLFVLAMLYGGAAWQALTGGRKS